MNGGISVDGYKRRKEQKKESIRRAALELLKVYGFKKVSINDIAVKAGVSPVTIYNHFGSKDELVRDVVKAQFLSMMEKFRTIIYSKDSFPEKLESIIFDKTEIASQFQGELVQTVLQVDSEMQKFIEDTLQQGGYQMTLDLLEEGKKEGYVSTELSKEALMIYLEILRKGISANVDLMANVASYADLVRELNYLFLYGLMGERTKKLTL
jgi:AcrR family transcriptional regulator